MFVKTVKRKPAQRLPIDLTLGAIERLKCPKGKAQAYLRDAKSPGLRVRVTSAGAKAFVYEAKLHRNTIRRTIGDVRSWSIEQARVEARRLAVLMDGGQDPRELDRQRQAAQTVATLTVGDVWPRYIAEGRPKRRLAWKPRYLADMEKMTSPGGQPKRRGKGPTLPGHLYPLLAIRLEAIDEDALSA